MKRKLTRKVTIFLALLLAVVSLVSAVAPALAANDDPSADSSVPILRDGLAIVAPVVARPNQPVTMTVFQRSDQTPMPDAGVWAFTADTTPQLDQEIARLRESGTAMNADTDWEAIVSLYGRFLGRTDNLGKLTATFGESGRYLLVAVKRGYLPGRTGIGIVQTMNALAIRAPQQAEVNEVVTIAVYDRHDGTPVQGAGVWAFTKEQAEALKAEIEASGQAINADTDWESLLSVRGIFLGRTGDTGEVQASFPEKGGYLLMAAKPRYLPARAAIRIGSKPQPLALQVQGRAKISEEVPVHVMNRLNGEPVEGAAVWALTRDDAAAFRQDMARLQESNTADAATDFSASLSAHGYYLGATDERGNLVTAFGQPGIWVLVTWKPGYLPGMGVIQVVGPDADQVRPSDQPDAARRAPAPDVEPLPDDGNIVVVPDTSDVTDNATADVTDNAADSVTDTVTDNATDVQ